MFQARVIFLLDMLEGEEERVVCVAQTVQGFSHSLLVVIQLQQLQNFAGLRKLEGGSWRSCGPKLSVPLSL